MPIKIPDNLPAAHALEQELVPIIREMDAIRQDIRPVRIALLNLMPLKEITETQFARLIGATPLQVELTLISMESHESKNVSRQHLERFYSTSSSLRHEFFDGLIVTGAPVELYDYDSINYWPELTKIFDWARTNVWSSLFICWGAQAALNHYYNIPKHILTEKKFGVYNHELHDMTNRYLRGFTRFFPCPVSRHTEIRVADITPHNNLNILAHHDDAGLCLLEDTQYRDLYMFNHLEYDNTSLADEYWRDKNKNLPITMPCNYFPNDDDSNMPINTWRSHAHLLIGNWINAIYQDTPFNISDIASLHNPPSS